jgi:hypothetical protein
LIDALTDYDVEPDDPARSVPNPARKEVEKQLRLSRIKLNDLRKTYGSAALHYLEGRTPTMRAFTAGEKKIRQEITETLDRIAGLEARRKSLPARIPHHISHQYSHPFSLNICRGEHFSAAQQFWKFLL